jgi:hypothetical protein
MFLTGKANLIGGVAMIVMAISTVIVVALTASSGVESDPYDRGEVATFLTDLADHQDAMIAAGAVGLFSDAVVALVVAATLFVLFRDRSPVLAPIIAVAIISAATISATNDLPILLTVVADDFVSGGAGNVPAGDASTLELGRLLGMTTFGLFLAVNAAIGLAFISLGCLVAFAPDGAVNPPRWLGWVAMLSAAASWLSPLVFVHDALFVFFPAQLITLLVVFLGLGGWLVTHRDQPMESTARVTAQPGVAG